MHSIHCASEIRSGEIETAKAFNSTPIKRSNQILVFFLRFFRHIWSARASVIVNVYARKYFLTDYTITSGIRVSVEIICYRQNTQVKYFTVLITVWFCFWTNVFSPTAKPRYLPRESTSVIQILSYYIYTLYLYTCGYLLN